MCQQVAAYSDQLDVRWFVPGMRLDEYEFLTSVLGRSLPTACSWWLCRQIHSRRRSGTFLRSYGHETDIPFVREQERSRYKVCIKRVLRRLRYSTLGRDTAQNLVIPHVVLCCFDCPFPTAWFSACCNDFWYYLDFEHRLEKRPLFLLSRLHGLCWNLPHLNPWPCTFLRPRALPWAAWFGITLSIAGVYFFYFLASTTTGCLWIAFSRLFVLLPEARMMSVLRRGPSGLLPKKYTVLMESTTKINLGNHCRLHYDYLVST